jgi:prephenate dehydrogenase
VVEVVSAHGFGRLGIVGVGLIGGSVALAARRRCPEVTIVGFEPSVSVDISGVVDERASSLRDLANADLIVVCAPVASMADTLGEIAHTATAALVTDVSSTKRSVMAAAAGAGLRSFVGGHPMAGSERPGLEAARADLFEGRPWLLVNGSAERSLADRLDHFVRALGAVPRWMEADVHDRTVAYVSHLPQILAAALMNAADGNVGDLGPLTAGNAFGEMTRLASSPVAMWESVLEDNADFVGEALAALQRELPDRSSSPGDWVKNALPRSGEARARWRHARSKDV